MHRKRSASVWRLTYLLAITLRVAMVTLLASAAPEVRSTPQDAAAIQPADVHVLNGQVFHVQGLDMDNDAIYVTSVDTAAKRGLLHKFSRRGEALGTVDITDGRRYHVGGIALDDQSIWIPVAEYRRDSTTRIVRVDKQTMRIVASFVVRDHIGALAVAGDRLYGGNWDSQRLYTWDLAGTQLAAVANPTRVAYQDLKVVGGELVAGGVMKDRQTGVVDWLDLETLAPRRRLPLGTMDNGLPWTREGMALKGSTLYVLPADGYDNSAQVYAFDLGRLSADITACDPPRPGSDPCLHPRPPVVALR